MLVNTHLAKSSCNLVRLSTLDLNSAVDSIFIIKSLMLAILKDCTNTSSEIDNTITELTQEIFYLERKGTISDVDFFYIDTHFYLILTQLKGFQRLADIIQKEKLNIDRTLRLFSKGKESYISIIKIYNAILAGIQSKNHKNTLSAVGALCDFLTQNITTAKENYPELFLQ